MNMFLRLLLLGYVFNLFVYCFLSQIFKKKMMEKKKKKKKKRKMVGCTVEDSEILRDKTIALVVSGRCPIQVQVLFM